MSYPLASFASILDAFSACFTAPSQRNFMRLVCGWVLCQGRHTLSRVIQAAQAVEPRVQHARLYRFFARARWEPDDLAHVLFELLLSMLPRVIEVSVDDTLCKKGGAQIFGAAMHRDGSASGYAESRGGGARLAFGHSWVVLSVRVPMPATVSGAIAVPLMARLYRGKKHCPHADYAKRTELAQQMIAQLADWLPQDRRLSVVGDAEYACRTVVRELPERVDFVGPVCRDAALHEQPVPYCGRGRPPKKGARLPALAQLAECSSTKWSRVTARIYGRKVRLLVKSLVCLWPTVAGERQVRVVIVRDPTGRYRDRYYFCTDLKLSPQQVIERAAHRWEIEVTFRDVKQLLGVADPQNGWWRRKHGSRRDNHRPGPEPNAVRGRSAVERTMPLGLLVHGLIVIWYARHGSSEREVNVARQLAPWQRDKRHIYFADMLAALRDAMWRNRISAYPLPERVRRKLIRLLTLTWRRAA